MTIETIIKYNGSEYEIDLGQPIDISIPVSRSGLPNAFYLPKAEYSTVEDGGFVGDVNRGGSCNVENISFSPHGNGTHTECSGHIAGQHHLVNNLLSRHFFLARLVTVAIEQAEDGSFISKKILSESLSHDNIQAEALILRTLPNDLEKQQRIYGGTNPPFISAQAMTYIIESGIDHLLTDLPSVDKEDDNKLVAHHIFFGDDSGQKTTKTITEMIYADNKIDDGLYWLDLQISGFESDASPSKPILYKTRLISNTGIPAADEGLFYES